MLWFVIVCHGVLKGSAFSALFKNMLRQTNHPRLSVLKPTPAMAHLGWHTSNRLIDGHWLPDGVRANISFAQKFHKHRASYHNILKSLQQITHPPSLSRPRYDIFSWAVRIDRPYGALKTFHTGDPVVGVGVAIAVLMKSTTP